VGNEESRNGGVKNEDKGVQLIRLFDIESE